MMLSSPFLPAGKTEPLWAPTSYVSPCFAHVQSEGTTRCLSKTQVALHLQKAYYEGLAAKAKEKEQGWDRQRGEMEDQLRNLKVRNMEAERLFKIQEKHLDDQLERVQDKLGQLEKEHKELKDSNAESLGKLRADFAELQRHCDELEHERRALKCQLDDADVTAAARKAADKKVGELEDAISNMKQRTERVMAELRRQKEDAEKSRDLFWRSLEGSQKQLEQEEQARKASDHQAKVMTQNWQRMEAALRLERLINEPLRHSNHTTTTTSHVLTSYAAPIVAERYHDPSVPLATWPAPASTAANPCPSNPHVGGAGSSATNVSEIATAAAGAGAGAPCTSYGGTTPLDAAAAQGYLQLLSRLAQAGRHASSFLVPDLDEPKGKRSCQQQHACSATYACPAECAEGRQRSTSSTTFSPLKHDDLTRLSRAWATTTPTAGFPHVQFLDNVDRYKGSYQASKGSCSKIRPKSSGQKKGQRPSKAVRDAYYLEAGPAKAASKQERSAQPRGSKHWAP